MQILLIILISLIYIEILFIKFESNSLSTLIPISSNFLIRISFELFELINGIIGNMKSKNFVLSELLSNISSFTAYRNVIFLFTISELFNKLFNSLNFVKISLLFNLSKSSNIITLYFVTSKKYIISSKYLLKTDSLLQLSISISTSFIFILDNFILFMTYLITLYTIISIGTTNIMTYLIISCVVYI